MSKKKVILIILVILLISIFPYLLTRVAIFQQLDFTQTGSIGDTIGGITSPLIGVISSVLIYVSFQEQLKANQQLISIRSEDFQIIGADKLISRIDDGIKELSSYKITTSDISFNHNPATEELLHNSGIQNLTNYIIREWEDIARRLGNKNEEQNVSYIIDKLNSNTGIVQLQFILILFDYVHPIFEKLPPEIKKIDDDILQILYYGKIELPLRNLEDYFNQISMDNPIIQRLDRINNILDNKRKIDRLFSA